MSYPFHREIGRQHNTLLNISTYLNNITPRIATPYLDQYAGAQTRQAPLLVASTPLQLIKSVAQPRQSLLHHIKQSHTCTRPRTWL